MPTKTKPRKRSRGELTPLQLTKQVKDISTTERGTFKTCRRRWDLQVIQNLAPRIPRGMALDFGSGIHEALEAYYLRKADTPEYIQEPASPVILDAALNAWDRWYYWADERIEKDPELMSEAKASLGDELIAWGDLGEEMLRGYHQFAQEADDFTVHAVEGIQTGAGQSWLKRHFDDREEETNDYATDAAVILHQPSGRLLVPIVDPDTRKTLPGLPCLSAKIDLLAMRRPEGVHGLWIYDHKSSEGQPSDRGLDFDDQATSYSYAIWRWLGILPIGVCFNYLIKQAPKEPRILKRGALSTAKDQLTTAQLYRAELRRRGLMLKDGTIKDKKYEEAYKSLLSYGWDRFFKRHYVTRNLYELLNFEARLFDEYWDMVDVHNGRMNAYPNFSRMWCPGCEMAPLCQAMEDGSDVEAIRETRFMQAPDRKASRRY